MEKTNEKKVVAAANRNNVEEMKTNAVNKEIDTNSIYTTRQQEQIDKIFYNGLSDAFVRL